MKRGVIMSGIENEKLADHLSLNVSRLVTYDDLKTELKTICSSRRRWAAVGSGGDGVVPMQVGATGKGKGKDGKGKGKDGKGKKGDSKGKKGDPKGKDRETRSCHYCGKAGHLAADCRRKKAGEKKGRKFALLTDATQVQPSASTASTALKGGSTGSHSSLAPTIDVSHAAAVPAQTQLQQQRSPPSTSATVHIANIQVAGDADIPTPEEYYWQVGMMYATTQCDALPVTVGDSVQFDWALCDTSSGLTTCPQEFANMTEMLPPQKPPLCESATCDEVMSMGTRAAAAESDGAPLQIEFQVTNVKRAIVGADAFTEGGHVPIPGKDPYILLADGREIKLYRSERTFWLRIRRPVENVAEPMPVNPARPNTELPAMARINQTRKDIIVRVFDDSEKTEGPHTRLAGPGRLIPLVCIDYLFLGDIEGDPLAVLNILEYQSGAIGRDPKSKGAIENADIMVEGMFRTLRASIESRYSVKEDGLAPYQHLKGRAHGGAICEFGETVMYKIQNAAHHKAEIRWGKAVWVGKDRADEHLLATAAGRKTARTIDGRVEDQRWSKSLFNKVECTPWDTRAGPEAAPPPPRRRYITRAIIDRFGPTPVCDDCYGLGHPRTESCRDRTESLPKAKEDKDKQEEGEICLLSLHPPTSNLHQQHRLQRHLLPYMAQGQEEPPAQEQQDGMELGMVEMGWNGTVVTEKPRRKQKVIAGPFVNVATAVLALTCDAIPYDSETDTNKHSLYDRGSTYQNVLGAREKDHMQMEEFQVCDRVPKNFAKGKRVRGKGVDDERYDDDGRVSVRSRFVAMQFAWGARGDTFAGAPPLAAFWLVVSFASSLFSTGVGYDGVLALYDVSAAFFHAYIDEDIYAVPPRGEEPEGSFLKRTVAWCPEDFGIMHDRKHVEILVSTMLSRKIGESNTTKRTITPSSKTIGKDCRESSDELSTEYATTCRSMAPTAFKVAHDRFDIQQAVGYPMRGMVLVVEVDSDWASEPGRSSVDGGFLFIGSHLIDGWSGQQYNHALSSAEAEFTGIVNGSARGTWLRNVMLEMGFEVTLQVNTGSSGAKGIASRLGCGKVRHLETKYLWVQEKAKDRTITMAKIHADVNGADMQTKPMTGPRLLKLLAFLPLRTPSSGRTQAFGVTLAATILGGVQGSA
ncbi:unnamed protein product, partial [Prorocentrum cordatum]